MCGELQLVLYCTQCECNLNFCYTVVCMADVTCQIRIRSGTMACRLQHGHGLLTHPVLVPKWAATTKQQRPTLSMRCARLWPCAHVLVAAQDLHMLATHTPCYTHMHNWIADGTRRCAQDGLHISCAHRHVRLDGWLDASPATIPNILPHSFTAPRGRVCCVH